MRPPVWAPFMLSAGVFATLLEYTASPIHQAIPDPLARRVLMGLAIAIIYSPWGKQSGAHINPAVTLTFFRLGKVEPPDILFYVTAQFAGGLAGVARHTTWTISTSSTAPSSSRPAR